MPETLEEKLKRIADEAWEGTAEKQKLLVNRNFRVESVELVSFTDAKGKDAEAYVAAVVLDGDEEPRNFWLGGRLVMPQVAALVEDGNLPVRLTLIEDPDLKGTPYRLTPAPVGVPTLPGDKDASPLPWACGRCGHGSLDWQREQSGRKPIPGTEANCPGCGHVRGAQVEPEPDEVPFE